MRVRDDVTLCNKTRLCALTLRHCGSLWKWSCCHWCTHRAVSPRNHVQSTILNFPLLVPILNMLPGCINSSSLFLVAILCTLLHSENTSFEVWYLHQEEHLDLPYWTMILAILSFGRRIQVSGHSDTGIFNNVSASSILTWVSADTASAVCPAHLGSLDIMSINFAAVICDVDAPCSVNASYNPESSFTISPRSTTRPLYF